MYTVFIRPNQSLSQFKFPHCIKKVFYGGQVLLLKDIIHDATVCNLHCLDLGNSGLRCIEGIQLLVNLKVLFLNRNQLTTIPKMSNLKLTHLSLCDNMLYNSALENIYDVRTLVYLNLDNNPLSELGQVHKLVALEILILSRTLLNNCRGIERLQSLKSLNLSSNNLRHLPEEVCQCRFLVNLTLDFNKLNWLPASIANLRQLQTLSLVSNVFHDIPSVIDTLPNLNLLNMEYNNLSKNVRSIDHLSKLRVLSYLHTSVLHQMQFVKSHISFVNSQFIRKKFKLGFNGFIFE